MRLRLITDGTELSKIESRVTMLRSGLFLLLSFAVATVATAQNHDQKGERDNGKLRKPSMIELRTDPPETAPPKKSPATKSGHQKDQKTIVVYLPSSGTQTKLPSAVLAGDFPRPEGFQQSVTVQNSERTIPLPKGKSAYQPKKQQTLRKPKYGQFPTNYRK